MTTHEFVSAVHSNKMRPQKNKIVYLHFEGGQRRSIEQQGKKKKQECEESEMGVPLWDLREIRNPNRLARLRGHTDPKIRGNVHSLEDGSP